MASKKFASEDLMKRAREWVETQGYPLEMLVARAFTGGGFEIRQTEIYRDGATEKAREIDLIAQYPDYRGVCRIVVTVECKSSSKPWILFSTESGLAGTSVYWSYSLMSETAREALVEAAPFAGGPTNSIFDQFERLKWLRKKSVAYAVRQAFSDADTAYTALTSTMKAASYLVRSVRETGFPQIRFAFPVVVIDSPLFLCRLNSSFKPELQQVFSGEVLFTSPDRQEDTTCIRIITLQRLAQFVREAQGEVERLTEEVRPASERIWQDSFGSQMPPPFEGLDDD
jgi:hypothetical protein